MLPDLVTYLPALNVVIAGGAGVIIAGGVLLYGRRHEQWSRQRDTQR
jgi:uncharacterized membrane protein SpoIIM required for sporulation